MPLFARKREPIELDAGLFEKLQANIPTEWIEQALEATGTATIRRRRLPAEQVIWLVLGMALYRDRTIATVANDLDLALGGKRWRVAPSAIPQARARVGSEPLRWLFERCATKWAGESAREHAWRGLAVYGVDGTTVRVPDSDENRAHFGGQSADAKRGASGYPLLRAVTLMALRSHLVAAMRFGPYAKGETTLAQELWPQVPGDSLCIVDRNFLVMGTLQALTLEAPNRHWLTRAKSTTKWTVVKPLGKGDALVEIRPGESTRRADPSLPEVWTVRAIEYQRPGFRPQTLLTSLLDAHAYPAAEIVALYHERWEIELGYNEVKTRLLERREAIRSKSVVGVAQELWGIALLYNLVRLEMQGVARQAGVPPSRVSFTAALNAIRLLWIMESDELSHGRLPERLRHLREDIALFILPPRRSERSYPRAVKIKMSNYARKRPPALRAAGRAK